MSSLWTWKYFQLLYFLSVCIKIFTDVSIYKTGSNFIYCVSMDKMLNAEHTVLITPNCKKTFRGTTQFPNITWWFDDAHRVTMLACDFQYHSNTFNNLLFIFYVWSTFRKRKSFNQPESRCSIYCTVLSTSKTSFKQI